MTAKANGLSSTNLFGCTIKIKKLKESEGKLGFDKNSNVT
jgi:hypothetical protein